MRRIAPWPTLWISLWLAPWTLAAMPVGADGEAAGVFDHYVLSLSWSPNWCARTGDARDADQCDARHDFGWILHGLWPQFRRGWPAYCRTVQPPPSRTMTAAMTDVMGSSGLAWHSWKKHGTCSGLPAADYFGLSRRAYDAVVRPEVLRKLDHPVRLPARLIRGAFLQANPAIDPGGLSVTCKGGGIAEVRVCLSKTLAPVLCGRDTITSCSAEAAIFRPIR